MGRTYSTCGKIRNSYKILVKNLKGSDLLRDLGIEERII
jgi:hypothetical protein